MKPENERSTMVLAIDLAVVMFILTAMFPLAKLPMRLFCLFSRKKKHIIN